MTVLTTIIDYLMQDPNGIIKEIVLALFALTFLVSITFVILTVVESYRAVKIQGELKKLEDRKMANEFVSWVNSLK